jgi:hypothetical protein
MLSGNTWQLPGHLLIGAFLGRDGMGPCPRVVLCGWGNFLMHFVGFAWDFCIVFETLVLCPVDSGSQDFGP